MPPLAPTLVGSIQVSFVDIEMFVENFPPDNSYRILKETCFVPWHNFSFLIP
jgi:hypothetical protein